MHSLHRIVTQEYILNIKEGNFFLIQKNDNSEKSNFLPLYQFLTTSIGSLTFPLFVCNWRINYFFIYSVGIENDAVYAETFAKYGENKFHIPLPTFSQLYKEQALAPFFAFQVRNIVLAFMHYSFPSGILCWTVAVRWILVLCTFYPWYASSFRSHCSPISHTKHDIATTNGRTRTAIYLCSSTKKLETGFCHWIDSRWFMLVGANGRKRRRS